MMKAFSLVLLSPAARVERRSLLLGVMACCRLGDESAAGALWQHMASLYGEGSPASRMDGL